MIRNRKRRLISPSTVTVTPTAATILEAGFETEQLTAVVKNVHGTTITFPVTTRGTWSSSDEAVATVDADGLVTAAGPGTADINFTTEAYPHAADLTPVVITVTANNVPDEVNVTAADLTLTHPITMQCTAVVTNAEGRVLTGVAGTWSSTDPSKATVDSSGLVTTVAAGTTDINFTTTTGSVADATPPTITVS